MRLKLFLSLVIALTLSAPSVWADTGPRDYAAASTTVKIKSYRYRFVEEVEPVSGGSGTMIARDGLILTNRHVIYDQDEKRPLDAFAVCLTFDFKKDPVCEYTAELVAHEEERDLALLRLSPRDTSGRLVPQTLPFLDYREPPVIQKEDRLQIVGYPASGGESITVTQGQVSGFETFNERRYVKTDTDFDHGSSGGTVLNAEGRLIGIPTYIRSYAENVGYFLDLQEALPWIEARKGDAPDANGQADRLLRDRLKRIAESNEKLEYTHPVYPFFQFDFPEQWKVASATRDAVGVVKNSTTDPLALNVELSFYQYPIDDAYFAWLYKDLDRMKRDYADYKRESVILGGHPADRISYTTLNQKFFHYYLPYGYAMAHLTYRVDFKKRAEQEKEIEAILQSIHFMEDPLPEPDLPEAIVFREPAFRISSRGGWRFQKHLGLSPEGLIAEAVEQDNFEGYIFIYYLPLTESDRARSTKERAEESIRSRDGGYTTLVYKNDEVALDGLPGWLATYEYEGNEFQQIRRYLEVHLDHGDYEWVMVYDDLADDFERNLNTIHAILRSFKNDDPDQGTEAKDVYQFGSLSYPFDDLRAHRFAGAISRLADKGIIPGGASNGAAFYPERPASRAQTVEWILTSKNHLEAKRGDQTIDLTLTFDDRQACHRRFSDLKTYTAILKYLCYAGANGVVSGYSDGTLRPERTVTLAEALSMLMRVYEIPVWNNPHGTVAWTKPYMDKGFELGLIPFGLFDPGHRLTRAELAHLIDTLYNQAR